MRRQNIVLLLMLMLAFPSSIFAGSLNTVSIISKTASGLSCLQWRPIGACFWLRCSWFKCKVKVSLKVGHYNPDLVVSAYNELGGNPWREVSATLGRVQKSTAGTLLASLLGVSVGSAGNRTEGSRHREHRNMIYRDADAIGHPIGTINRIISLGGLSCPSQATPFVPYFQSALDALSWRTEIPETFYPASVIPGMREMGSWPAYTWGSLYPRTGWNTQTDEPKAAAIIVQRVGDIVTRRGQAHVYMPLSGSPSYSGKIWPPGPLVERNSRSGKWQMLTPRTDRSCSIFGTNDLASVAGWGGGKVDSGGDYAWNLWRPYKCCRRRGQWFLFSVNWMPYP